MGGNLDQADRHHHGVQQEVADDQRDGQPDGFAESGQEHGSQHRQQDQGDHDLLVLEEPGSERVLHHVGGGVGRGQGDGDDPGGGHKAEQDQDEQLAAPERQQPLQHGHRAMPVRALGRHPPVYRQHPEQREQHDQQRASGDKTPAARTAIPGR
jgi:hypothetical protein